MTAVPPPRAPYTGPVLVDPGNDRPGLHPDYGYTAPSRAPLPHRPWALQPFPPTRRRSWGRALMIMGWMLVVGVLAAHAFA